MTNDPNRLPETNWGAWQSRPFHRQYLMTQASRLFDFFEASSINTKGGFFELSDDGQPLSPENGLRQVHVTTRMIHCATIGRLIGRPGSDEIVDHGMRYLWEKHRDQRHGGFLALALGHRDQDVGPGIEVKMIFLDPEDMVGQPDPVPAHRLVMWRGVDRLQHVWSFIGQHDIKPHSSSLSSLLAYPPQMSRPVPGHEPSKWLAGS